MSPQEPPDVSLGAGHLALSPLRWASCGAWSVFCPKEPVGLSQPSCCSLSGKIYLLSPYSVPDFGIGIGDTVERKT